MGPTVNHPTPGQAEHWLWAQPREAPPHQEAYGSESSPALEKTAGYIVTRHR